MTEKRPERDPQTQNNESPASWVDSHGDYLYNYAFSRLRDKATSEDVVQETYLAAFKSKSSFAGDSSLRTWLLGILRHKIADHLRRSFRQSKLDKELDVSSDLERVFRDRGKWTGHWLLERIPEKWSESPADILEKKEFWEILDSCLKKLPIRLHSVFVLYQLEEQSTEDICQELNITPTNLWTMLYRARLRLRRCLELNWAGKK
jgi:RNA polymerase sigma-70 factor (ECF subfamily)